MRLLDAIAHARGLPFALVALSMIISPPAAAGRNETVTFKPVSMPRVRRSDRVSEARALRRWVRATYDLLTRDCELTAKNTITSRHLDGGSAEMFQLFLPQLRRWQRLMPSTARSAEGFEKRINPKASMDGHPFEQSLKRGLPIRISGPITFNDVTAARLRASRRAAERTHKRIRRIMRRKVFSYRHLLDILPDLSTALNLGVSGLGNDETSFIQKIGRWESVAPFAFVLPITTIAGEGLNDLHLGAISDIPAYQIEFPTLPKQGDGTFPYTPSAFAGHDEFHVRGQLQRDLRDFGLPMSGRFDQAFPQPQFKDPLKRLKAVRRRVLEQRNSISELYLSTVGRLRGDGHAALRRHWFWYNRDGAIVKFSPEKLAPVVRLPLNDSSLSLSEASTETLEQLADALEQQPRLRAFGGSTS